jgi:peptidoglycan/xylan/chitin deacetylase (PgdA/CDA1 family)
MKTLADADRLAVLEELRAAAPLPAARCAQLTASDLLTLQAGGVEVENHTWSHPLLDRCDDQTVRNEIERAHHALVAALGRPPRAFAFPNGNWDHRAEQVLEHLGYRAGFLFDHRLCADVAEQPLRMSRVRVDSHTSLDRFAIITSGLHPALHHRRGRC